MKESGHLLAVRKDGTTLPVGKRANVWSAPGEGTTVRATLRAARRAPRH